MKLMAEEQSMLNE